MRLKKKRNNFVYILLSLGCLIIFNFLSLNTGLTDEKFYGENLFNSIHNAPLTVSSKANAHIDANTIKKYLENLPSIKHNNIKVKILNRHNLLFLATTTKPNKNIVLNKNYWENIFIIFSIDLKAGSIITIINGEYATGIAAPNPQSKYYSINKFYPQETKDFINLLEKQINQDESSLLNN